MTNRIITLTSIFGILIALITACANMNSALKGGAKDVTPPKLITSIPEINATNFHGKKIEITFDEFLSPLKDINKQMVISPPLKNKPVILQRNKSIYITLDDRDTLKANTTYTFYFGNAIQDLNEGNILKNYEFVFSTGDVVDSLSLRGSVVSCFDHSADKDGYYVMLYDKFNDSIPRKTLPNFVTRTDEKGYFTLSHLRADSFMIFALKDMNQNLKFDTPSELIGFSDTVIHITNQYFVPMDSILKDTTKFDSLRKVLPYLKPQIELFSFNEEQKIQYLSKSERPQPYKFNLIFNRPLFDSVSIKPLNFVAKKWFLRDKINKSDTLSYWITDTAVVHKDTLKTIITYSKLDSVGNYIFKSDTISLTNKKRIVSKSVKKDDAKKRVNDFKIVSPAEHADGFDLNKRLYISGTFPIQQMDTSKITLYKIGDTKEKEKIPVKYKITKDTVSLRNYWIDYKIDPNTSYFFEADSAAFTSIYSQNNDSTGFGYKIQKDDYYGTFKLTLSNVTQHMIVQLIGDRESVIKEKYLDADGPVMFDFLAPGKYRIKFIYDRNKNNKWDTGDFSKRIQPERVEYYKGNITIRSNWDINETWTLK